MGSGGYRPDAPQNNPANVSATGGNGQSGLNYSGFQYGMNKQINETKQAAPLAGSSTAPATPAAPMGAMLPEVTPLTAETQFPDQSIFDGTPLPGGAGPEALNLPMAPTGDAANDLVRQYLPIMQAWADMPGTSQDTKDYVNYFGTILQ